MSDAVHHHIDCRAFLSDLSNYLDGDIDDALRQEIEQHSAECRNCRVVVDTLRKTVQLYRCLPAEPMPAGLTERILTHLHHEKRTS